MLILKEVLQGTTLRLEFPILDPNGALYRPDTLTMSIYDVDFSVDPATETTVNNRNDVDVLGSVDSSGFARVELDEADTELASLPPRKVPSRIFRYVLFRWTWGAGRVGKKEMILPIKPDRKVGAV